MSAPRKFDAETWERAVRMYHEHLLDMQCSKPAARRHMGWLLDLNQATLRYWIEDRHTAEGAKCGCSRGAHLDEIQALRNGLTALERANEILKTCAAFFAKIVAGTALQNTSGHLR
ncbi:transposase [Pseudarthrobacter sp. NPDC058196]|uniref:transposase n=1 Tax=Pseudarthrobacter sp. NPDC058196 TaxID=3346376 RepID=UPI0036DB1E6C